ncbi:membrane protein [Campylobacterota bacterium]|nr:membrane protein [Campylobacterota bacterium]
MPIIRIVFIFLAFYLYVFAEDNSTEFFKERLDEISIQIDRLQNRVDPANNIWVRRFNNRRDFLALQTEYSLVTAEIKQLANKRDDISKSRRDMLEERSKTMELRIELLSKEESGTPYEGLIKTELPDEPDIENPFAIFTGLNYLKESEQILKAQRAKLESLELTIEATQEMQTLFEQRDHFVRMLHGNANIAEFAETFALLSSLRNLREVFATALSVQENHFKDSRAFVRDKIDRELSKIISIIVAIATIAVLGFILKLIIKRTVKDTNRLFSLNRAINIVAFIIIVLVLLFNYISNIMYFVTLLGFISAGIAIAMKDWFMSLLGWLVIVIGGSIHIGDRIRITREGSGDIIVGDVLEIGLTRIMLFEDITLATFDNNRRAGRIIHIPNNYVFTHIFQNYTYSEMQTVWDGIDIVVTFNSNHKKARKIARDIASKHAIGYTDQTRKHYNNLRTRFNLRAVSVEPRVFTFAHTYGVKVSIWYLTNSYATLSLRSVIGAEVIEAFNAAEGITIAYPTYTIGGKNISLEKEVAQNIIPDPQNPFNTI